MEIDHPIDDPSLPSYRHPTLRAIWEDLQRAFDAYVCLRGEGVKGKYLPPETEEPQDAYAARLERAVFADFYRDSIHAFAGVLSNFNLKNPPATLETTLSNVDRKGNSFKAWWIEADSLMLRDGGTGIQVEMPPNDSRNNAEVIANGILPYLVRRERSKITNWRFSKEDGELEWVTFLEVEPENKGTYGVEMKPRYRIVGRGFQQVLVLERNESTGKFTAVPEGPEVPILMANKQPMPRVPVVWYPADEADFGEGEQPLRQVVEHSISHFRKSSDLEEKTHKCAMPVPVVTGATPGDPSRPAQKVAIGPNSIIYLEQGGTFTFAEPSGSSLKEQREQIADTERLIAKQTLGFLYGDPGGAKTATQAGMEGAQTESGITRTAERKASAAQEVMAIWCLFTGEELDPEAGLTMSASIFERPMEAADVAQLQSLAGGVELISQRSAVEELIRRGKNQAVSSVEEELERLAAEVPPPAEDVGTNDLGGLPPVEPMEVPEEDTPDDDELET